MVEINKDKKSDTWITKTDSEGFHRQLNVTSEELIELIRNGIKLYFNKNL